MTKILPFFGAETIFNPSLQIEIQKYVMKCAAEGVLYDTQIHEQFIQSYRKWIMSSTFVFGLEQFAVSTYSNGTTESFDKFYLKHHLRRFRCFKGEYMYHPASGRNYCPSWKFLEDDKLDKNDAVVVSYPFSDTGEEHPKMKLILDQCFLLGIPVLIDCAFFGLTGKSIIDISHPAINAVTFSLSKFLPVSHLRIGIRFTKIDDDDTLLISHKHGYVNRLGAGVGLKIFENYRPDYNYTKYKELQEKFCTQLGIRPSKSVIFGIDEHNKYPEYSRGATSNRLCFSKYFHEETLPS